jgi:hypothetical protein
LKKNLTPQNQRPFFAMENARSAAINANVSIHNQQHKKVRIKITTDNHRFFSPENVNNPASRLQTLQLNKKAAAIPQLRKPNEAE